MSHNKSNSPNEGKQTEAVVEKSFKGGAKNKAFVASKAFVRAKTPSARGQQTKSPSPKCTAKTTIATTTQVVTPPNAQVDRHYYYGKEVATRCQTGLKTPGQQQQLQQHQSQAPPFAFRHNDPQVQHTVRCCSNETLDPCDNAERWMDLVKQGTLPAVCSTASSPSSVKAITLEVDLQQMDGRQEDTGTLLLTTATEATIDALPLPVLAGTDSSTTIDACLFPSVFSSSGVEIGGGSCVQSPRYMLTPLAPATAAYFRRLGVPSRIYGCQSALEPSQPGQLTFQLVDQASGQQQQQQQSPEPQQRAAFAIINVNHFNFVSRLH